MANGGFGVSAGSCRIFELWLACWTQAEIAGETNCDEKTVSNLVSGITADSPFLQKSGRASAEHATEFDVPLYMFREHWRRHLSESQRAMIAARVRKHYEPAAKERMSQGQKSGGRGKKKSAEKNSRDNCPTPIQRASDAAGATLNVSGKSVDRATTVLTKGSTELIAAVDRGEVAVSKAAKVAKSVKKPRQVAALLRPPPRCCKPYKFTA